MQRRAAACREADMAMLKKAKDEADKKKKKHPPSGNEKPAQDQEAPEADEAEDQQPAAESDESAPEGGAQAAGDSAAPQEPEQGGGDDDQSAPDAGQGQAVNNQQAATPVPNPQAPGAGDTTSGGEDTPPQGEGDTGGGMAPPDEGPDTTGPGMPQAEMTPALKQEYQRLDQMLLQALYKSPNDAIAGHLLQQLYPSGPHKIQSAIHACAVLARELFLKAKGPPQLTMPFTRDVVAHVLSLGEQVKQIPYSQQEIAAIMGGTLEVALKMFGGVKKSHFDALRPLIGRDAYAQHARNYTKLHAYVKPTIDANRQQPHPGAPQAGGPPAQAAGPQGPQGAPPATPAASEAPSGPPPAAAMPPAGGPLTQGAGAQ